MDKKIIIALTAIIIVAIIAVAALVVLNDDDDDKDEIPTYSSTTGTVYGNSDGNCYIDETDKRIMQAIIDGDRSLSDFPFADANCDGKVDAEDIAIVDKYLNKESVTLKVLDAEDKVLDIRYPIDTVIVLAGSNLAPLIDVLDITDKIVGAAYTGEKFNEYRDYGVANGVEKGTITKISTKGTTADLELVRDITRSTGCHFMMTEYSSMYKLDSDENVALLNQMGVDVLRLECRDPGQDLRSLAVFGILLDRSAQAQEYQNYIEGVYSQIKTAVGDKYGSEKALIGVMGSFAGPISGYTSMLEQAGGVSVADWEGQRRTVSAGDTWYLDEKYAVDHIFVCTASNYGAGGFSESYVTSQTALYQNHHAWSDGDVYLVSTSIPTVCRIAYIAQALYPDSFEEGWAHGIHQTFIDKYFETSYTVDDSDFMLKINA